MNRPLFIPLKTAYYNAFCDGTKTQEYRPEGPRWNARTCRVGRPVVISKGYGKNHRQTGVIVGYESSAEPTKTAVWRDCYGDRVGMAACIRIRLDLADSASIPIQGDQAPRSMRTKTPPAPDEPATTVRCDRTHDMFEASR